MADLKEARAAADRLRADFEQACKDHGFADHWDAYIDEIHTPWPTALRESHDVYIKGLHDFYELRDGPKGFLGGRGL